MSDARESPPETEVWIVERIDDGVAVLVLDDPDDESVISEVDAGLLGDHGVEGMVLQVPLGSVGEPVWTDAIPVEHPAQQ